VNIDRILCMVLPANEIVNQSEAQTMPSTSPLTPLYKPSPLAATRAPEDLSPEPSPPSLRTAVLDREQAFGNLLRLPMHDLGWQITVITELPDADDLRAMTLDVLLVNLDSTEADLAWLSHRAIEMPKVTILAYSETSTVVQRVKGLQAGLDGWIDRACDPHEVLARIQAIVRARHGRRATIRPPIRSGDLLVDVTRYDAMAGGYSAGMTTREFEVFALLVENSGRVLTREDIYAGVWGSDTPSGDRSVDMFVSRIRLKLKRLSPNWSYLHTHVGLGYRFEAQHDSVTTGILVERPTPNDPLVGELMKVVGHASKQSAVDTAEPASDLEPLVGEEVLAFA
jgi:DNA-binding response OmpR family regulator